MKLNINLQLSADVKEQYKVYYTRKNQTIVENQIINEIRSKIANWLGNTFENDLITMDIKFMEDTV